MMRLTAVLPLMLLLHGNYLLKGEVSLSLRTAGDGREKA
jgi:hypothetical protein